MNWCQNIWWEISYWFKYHWQGLIFSVLLLLIICTVVYKAKDIPPDVLFPPRVERITSIIEGELVTIRATGSFSSYDTELKFADGSMILVTYSFSRRNNLKEGFIYKIWDSSIHGKQCKQIKGDK